MQLFYVSLGPVTGYDGMTFGGRNHPGQHPNGGCLSGTIGTQEAQYLASFNCQGQVFNCGGFSEVSGKAKSLNYRHAISLLASACSEHSSTAHSLNLQFST